MVASKGETLPKQSIKCLSGSILDKDDSDMGHRGAWREFIKSKSGDFKPTLLVRGYVGNLDLLYV